MTSAPAPGGLFSRFSAVTDVYSGRGSATPQRAATSTHRRVTGTGRSDGAPGRAPHHAATPGRGRGSATPGRGRGSGRAATPHRSGTAPFRFPFVHLIGQQRIVLGVVLVLVGRFGALFFCRTRRLLPLVDERAIFGLRGVNGVRFLRFLA